MALRVNRSYDVVDRPTLQIRFGAGGTLTLKAFDDGTQIIPTAATINVKRPTGSPCTTPVVNAACTIDGAGTMTYALSAGNADLLQGQFGAYAPWTAEWTITAASSSIAVDYYLQTFDVVRWQVRCVTTTADLQNHRPDLSSAYMASETSAQIYIDQAFEDIYRDLCSKGKRPYLMISNEELRRPTEHLALAKFYEARQKAADDRWASYATFHRHAFDTWFTGKTFTYDWDQSGTVDPSEVNKPFGLDFKI